MRPRFAWRSPFHGRHPRCRGCGDAPLDAGRGLEDLEACLAALVTDRPDHGALDAIDRVRLVAHPFDFVLDVVDFPLRRPALHHNQHRILPLSRHSDPQGAAYPGKPALGKRGLHGTPWPRLHLLLTLNKRSIPELRALHLLAAWADVRTALRNHDAGNRRRATRAGKARAAKHAQGFAVASGSAADAVEIRAAGPEGRSRGTHAAPQHPLDGHVQSPLFGGGE